MAWIVPISRAVSGTDLAAMARCLEPIVGAVWCRPGIGPRGGVVVGCGGLWGPMGVLMGGGEGELLRSGLCIPRSHLSTHQKPHKAGLPGPSSAPSTPVKQFYTLLWFTRPFISCKRKNDNPASPCLGLPILIPRLLNHLRRVEKRAPPIQPLLSHGRTCLPPAHPRRQAPNKQTP